jgi:hypothetical protein
MHCCAVDWSWRATANEYQCCRDIWYAGEINGMYDVHTHTHARARRSMSVSIAYLTRKTSSFTWDYSCEFRRWRVLFVFGQRVSEFKWKNRHFVLCRRLLIISLRFPLESVRFQNYAFIKTHCRVIVAKWDTSDRQGNGPSLIIRDGKIRRSFEQTTSNHYCCYRWLFKREAASIRTNKRVHRSLANVCIRWFAVGGSRPTMEILAHRSICMLIMIDGQMSMSIFRQYWIFVYSIDEYERWQVNETTGSFRAIDECRCVYHETWNITRQATIHRSIVNVPRPTAQTTRERTRRSRDIDGSISLVTTRAHIDENKQHR